MRKKQFNLLISTLHQLQVNSLSRRKKMNSNNVCKFLGHLYAHASSVTNFGYDLAPGSGSLILNYGYSYGSGSGSLLFFKDSEKFGKVQYLIK